MPTKQEASQVEMVADYIEKVQFDAARHLETDGQTSPLNKSCLLAGNFMSTWLIGDD